MQTICQPLINDLLPKLIRNDDYLTVSRVRGTSKINKEWVNQHFQEMKLWQERSFKNKDKIYDNLFKEYRSLLFTKNPLIELIGKKP